MNWQLFQLFCLFNPVVIAEIDQQPMSMGWQLKSFKVTGLQPVPTNKIC